MVCGSGCWGVEKDGAMAPDEALALGPVLGKKIYVELIEM